MALKYEIISNVVNKVGEQDVGHFIVIGPEEVAIDAIQSHFYALCQAFCSDLKYIFGMWQNSVALLIILESSMHFRSSRKHCHRRASFGAIDLDIGKRPFLCAFGDLSFSR